jgi:hypothetical protein
MNLAVVIACVVAMLTAALLIPFRNYAHALIWSRRFALVGLGGYLLANAAAGVVGWLVARKLGWRPEDVWLRPLARARLPAPARHASRARGRA